MTELDDARRLLASHFPHAPITWFGCGEPTASSVVAATAEAFRHAYVVYANGHTHGGANWASDAFSPPAHSRTPFA